VPSVVKKLLLALGAVLLLAAALLLALGGTTGGTRLLAGQLTRLTGNSLAWDHLQGRLLGELELRGVSYRQPDQSIQVDLLYLNWRPNALLGGRLAVDRLRAEGVQVQLAATDQPPEDTGPPAGQRSAGGDRRRGRPGRGADYPGS
jgi:translocation and assembly module TamB